MPKQRAGWLRQIWRGQRGTTAVEFALVATPLIWLLGIICETGAFLVVQYQLQYAVDRIARTAVTNTMTATDAATFKSRICEILTVRNCANSIYVDVRSADTFAGLALPALSSVGPSTSTGSYSDTFNPGSAGKPGSMIVTYDWKFIFPFMGKTFGFNNIPNRTEMRRLHGISIYMREKN